jgi:hypothetical protein
MGIARKGILVLRAHCDSKNHRQKQKRSASQESEDRATPQETARKAARHRGHPRELKFTP